MALTYRISDTRNWPANLVNKVVTGDALRVMKRVPDSCISLIVTSPPYWNQADYGVEGQIGQTDYESYLAELMPIWREAVRVLIPNGKMAVVTPIMPIRKSVIGDQHTRHLKNINNDIEHMILKEIPALKRFSLFVWQKQTSVKMFGSYPYPPNIFEDNTIEFISVYVKDGVPPTVSQAAKEGSKLTQEEWLNLTMQTWPIYPEDVRRSGGHPCPFPVVLPQRLAMMYTFRRAPEADFSGDIVLDMFNGTGATCVAARALGRNYIGIDLNPDFCKIAKQRLLSEEIDPSAILLEKPRVRQPANSRALELFPEIDSSEISPDNGSSDI